MTAWISDVPGMGEAKLRVAGNIHSNGAFRVSGSADTLSFSGFALDVDASVAVANYNIAAEDDETLDPEALQLGELLDVRVYFDGSLANTLLGANFSAKGDLATDGTGELTLALSSNGDSFNYNGLKFKIPDGSSTVKLQQELVDGNLSGSVWFDGEISDVPGMGVAKLDVSGNIHSNGAFRVSGSCR